MARPHKQTADYFPHYASHGKTLYILEAKYGNDGYAFWFKLLETLCTSNGHVVDVVTAADMAFMAARTGVSEETATEILDLLATLGGIDAALWQANRQIWCQNLVDNLADLYRKRTADLPIKPGYQQQEPVIRADKAPETQFTAAETHKTKQNKTKQSKVESGDLELSFKKYCLELASRYPTLNIDACWLDCLTWYNDKGKVMANAKMCLNNWCKKELEIGRPKRNGPKPLPTTKELKEGWQ